MGRPTPLYFAERLTARMVRFTPMAASDPPHGVMLDITADGAVHLVLDWVRRTTA